MLRIVHRVWVSGRWRVEGCLGVGGRVAPGGGSTVGKCRLGRWGELVVKTRRSGGRHRRPARRRPNWPPERPNFRGRRISPVRRVIRPVIEVFGGVSRAWREAASGGLVA